MAKNKIKAADEVIQDITEVLLRASGETIEETARAAGIPIKYVGDSMFEVEEE